MTPAMVHSGTVRAYIGLRPCRHHAVPTRCPNTEGRAFFDPDIDPRRTSRGSILALVGFLGLCLLVGVADGAVTATSVRSWYPQLLRPSGTPPNWLFGPVWTVLYGMIGVAAWLVWRQLDPVPGRKYAALRLWGWQLLLNALWTPAFFGLRSTGLGLVVILVLVPLIGLTIRAFMRVDHAAAWLMLPYLAWTGYAAYLNAGFWWLNRG